MLMCVVVSPFFIHEIRDLTNLVDRLHKIMQRKFRYAMYCVHRMIASVSYLSQYLSFLLFLSLPTLFFVCLHIFFSFIVYFTFYNWIWRNEKWISIVSLCSLMIHIFCFCCLLWGREASFNFAQKEIL